ncbi:MAG: dipeptidase [candidate division KSB1 bacterium]|nr:dipeptidase [candidate division KSB1 bacterium]
MHRFLLLLLTGVLISACQSGQSSVEDRALRIHEAVLTVDTHIDWPSHQFRNPEFDPGKRHEPGRLTSGQWDLVRMKEGGLDAVFMSIFTRQGPRTEEGHRKAKDHAERLIQITRNMVSQYPNLAELALTPDDAYRIEKGGKRAIFMGMENGYPIGTDIRNVRYFYDLGIRYITLTHSSNNELGDSSTDKKQEWSGLSPLGEKVVREMNRLGIMVDISHVHDETFWDVIKLTQAPVIASHSSARALCDHPRNMSDDMLRAVKENGGVVQLCLLGNYIKKMPQDSAYLAARRKLRPKFMAFFQGTMSAEERAAFEAEYMKLRDMAPRPTLEDAVDHIDHMVQVMGIDHIGIGSDFDGGGGLKGIDDVLDMPNLTRALLKRGYSEEDIRKIWGGNLMRVFREVQAVAERLQTAEKPSAE